MKKLESTFKNMLVVLVGISVVAAGILAYVNMITAEPIAAIQAKKLDDAIKAVLGANDVTVTAIDTLDEATMVYSTSKGTAVQTATNGFGGTLKVLVGFNENGNIMGYNVLETQETPGLGAKAGEWFQRGAKGNIIGKHPGQDNLSVRKDGGEVDAITASTITSRAFLKAVCQAYDAFMQQGSNVQTGATTQASTNN